MKRLNLKKGLFVSLFLLLVGLLLMTVSSIQYAYADDSSREANSFSFAAEDDFKNRNYYDDIVCKERAFCDDSDDEESGFADVYCIVPLDEKIRQNVEDWPTARITTEYEGVSYPFDYHIRGYFGDYKNSYHRCNQIQFFYNMATKTLRILCFGDGKGKFEFKTYNYCALTRTTILEDKGVALPYHEESHIIIGDSSNELKKLYRCRISDEAERIEIDPRIEVINKRGFQNFHKLLEVDIVGQKYATCKLNHIASYAFRNCGDQNDYCYDGKHTVMFQPYNICNLRKGCKLSWDSDFNEGTHTMYYKSTPMM